MVAMRNSDTSSLIVVPTDLVAPDAQLVLNASAQVATLLQHGTICAQHYFSQHRFRLLVLLLKLPGGVLYAELLAILDCPEAVFQKILAATNEEAVSRALSPYTPRWRKHLAMIVQQGPREKRREMAVVWRLITGRNGLNTSIKNFGFAAYPVYKQGYVLQRLADHKMTRERK